jgi:hypothetical protein
VVEVCKSLLGLFQDVLGRGASQKKHDSERDLLSLLRRRLLDHLTEQNLLMAPKGKLEWMVLDEADRLLDMGLVSRSLRSFSEFKEQPPGRRSHLAPALCLGNRNLPSKS